MLRSVVILLLCALSFVKGNAQTSKLKNVSILKVGLGWAGNSVNTVVFRKNSLTSNDSLQFISYYDSAGFVVVGKRKFSDTSWELKRTIFKGNITDAHNSISIMLDGAGYLHMAWGNHNTPLHYCKSLQPLSLEMTDMLPMTGLLEHKISYPEFYKLPSGGLLFFFRDGGSGNGNLVMNRYDLNEKKWVRLQNNLIDGEGKRNAYWQACVDQFGFIHISWVWRESPDVASNHDLSYAMSRDGGISWQKSTGEKYQLPISIVSAEKICSIAQGSELINQTSMCVNEAGEPFIASYWKEKNGVPQYHIVYLNKNKWKMVPLNFRKTNFSLNGTGTKQIPISRPQILCSGNANAGRIWMVFRDEERGNKISIATAGLKNIRKITIADLTEESVGAWEPTYDTNLWNSKHILHLFVQNVSQADGEGLIKTLPKPVSILQYAK